MTHRVPGISLEDARRQEERRMLDDAVAWSKSARVGHEYHHPLTGATPTHVAAAKGYCKVLRILLQAGADRDAQDCDGWTPLHAAAHWGERDACQLLVDHHADMHLLNNMVSRQRARPPTAQRSSPSGAVLPGRGRRPGRRVPPAPQGPADGTRLLLFRLGEQLCGEGQADGACRRPRASACGQPAARLALDGASRRLHQRAARPRRRLRCCSGRGGTQPGVGRLARQETRRPPRRPTRRAKVRLVVF